MKKSTKLFKKLIRKEIKKTILKEGKVWERGFGEPLPTLKSVQEKHNANKRSLKEAGRQNLKVGKEYSVFDPGMAEWHDENEFLGIDDQSGDFMFRADVGSPGSKIYNFMAVPKEDVDHDVRDSGASGPKGYSGYFQGMG
jgi:hypothetical protein